MKIITGLLFSYLLSIATPAGSATIPSSNSAIIPVEGMYKKIDSQKVKDIQKLIGRKLTLKERIAFFILKQKLRHIPKETTNEGEIALIFGIAAVSLLVLSLFFPFLMIASLIASIIAIITGSVTKKREPGNQKAKTGKMLGLITLAIIAILFIILLVVFASLGTWSFG
jgi:flagellar biosynthesis protein FlhB